MSEPNNASKLRILALLFLVLVVSGGIFWFIGLNEKKSLVVVTDKNGYVSSGELKLKVENSMGKEICFSSCYPYSIQDKGDGWGNYAYTGCDKEDTISTCVGSKGVKAFAISLGNFSLGYDYYRLAIPACIGCAVGDKFRADETFYSNEFLVNK